MKWLTAITATFALAVAGFASASLEPLPELTEPVDLDRYAGDWFVHGAIPLRIPFFSDANARNYREHYERLSADAIRMTSSFATSDSPDARRRSFSFKGKVVDSPSNSTWSISIIWPIKAEYSIIYLDESYNTTIVASPGRNYAWIMSRESRMGEQEYSELLEFMDEAGFEPDDFRKVPHDEAT